LPPIGWRRDYLASDWLAWKKFLNSENQVKKSLPSIGCKRDYLAFDWFACKKAPQLSKSGKQVYKKLASYWLSKRISVF
jgi:hypothetical protein